jgi:ABC-2 type transport system permease protein
MNGVINSAYMNVVFSFFSNKFQRNIEEMLVAPMPSYIILCGYVAGGVMRGLIVGGLIIIVALMFTKLSVAHYWATFVFAFCTALLFSLAGFINGIFAKKFDDTSIVSVFILTPLTYLGGVFYSIDSLPLIWQKLTYLNPIFYIVNGFRYGMIGSADIKMQHSLAVILVLIVLGYAACIWLLRRGVGIRQ